jgi:Ca2+:H+ antiporter
MGRLLLWGSLLLVPLAAAGRLLGAPQVLVFLVGTAALAPLAWLISRATEEAGHHTGPAIGGLLTATFANAPEFLISMFAVADGLFDVVRGSLSGSVVGNLLLVLGVSLLVAGPGELDRASTRQALALLAFAIPCLLVAGLPNLVSGETEKAYGASIFPAAVALLLVYAVVVTVSVRREIRAAGAESGEAAWSLRRAVAVLAAATGATALMAEVVTGSIETFAETLHLSQFFVAAVILAIAGNAAENGAAVLVAAHGEIKLAGDVALESSAQVAAFLIPAIALVSWLLTPLPLAFTPVELGVFAGAATLAAVLLLDGRASRLRGAALLTGYAVVVAAFLLE